MGATAVIPAPTQRPSPSDQRVGYSHFVYEATHRFTSVTACSLAVWKLTTPRYRDAASSFYRGVRTTPRTGLQPARLTAVTVKRSFILHLPPKPAEVRQEERPQNPATATTPPNSPGCPGAPCCDESRRRAARSPVGPRLGTASACQGRLSDQCQKIHDEIQGRLAQAVTGRGNTSTGWSNA